MSGNNATVDAPTVGQTTAASTTQGPALAHDPVEIAAEEFTDDSASELGNSVASSSTSVSSSILDYRLENGRTYHKYKDGKYNIPNDETENDRLDLQHNLCLLTFGNTLGLAPPNKPDSRVNRVLDVGTGSGIWAIDFGEEHPDAEVYGIDLSPTMAEFVPPNVTFQVDDLEEEWTWSEPFDYIHSRFMNSCIADWKKYAKKAFDNLTPGGYFEIQDIGLFPQSDDGTLKPDSSLSKCIDLMYEASIIFGRPFQEIPALVPVFEEVGFIDVKLSTFKWPTNSWPKDPKYKELGIWNHENLSPGFEALTMGPFTRAHGWTREEVLVFLVGVRQDMRNRLIHAYWPIYVIHGRKPTEEELASD